jgi:type IV pilus assembly protein PilO
VTFEELNNLDFSNFGDWPRAVKGVVILLVIAVVAAAGYYFDTKDRLAELKQTESREQRLRTEFKNKQAKAANLDEYKRQLEEMRQSFGAMLKQLPDKTEVAALLVDVSQTGLAAGLEFELFQPMGEVQKDFYAELPIKLRVFGEYHEFGEFVSGLAALPRIVTIHDVQIEPLSEKDPKHGKLVLEATAKTYRYLEEEPEK